MVTSFDAAVALEQALLGAIISGYRDLPRITRIVSGSDFYRPAHEQLWNACLEVHSNGVLPDHALLRDHLGDAKLARMGGPAYLSELKDACSIAAQAPDYADKVRKASIYRQVAQMGARLQQAGESADPDDDALDLLARCRNLIDGFDSKRSNGLVSVLQSMESVLDVVDRGQAAGLSSPWPALDELLGGARPGQLIVLGARTSVGKSIGLENWATHIARDLGKPVLFSSLEMPHAEVTARTLSWTAKVDLKHILQGGDSLTAEERDRIDRAAQLVTTSHLHYDDKPNQSVLDIRASAWEAKQAAIRAGYEFGGIFVDYLQLVKAANPRVSRQQQVGEVTRGLKQLAKELECPVFSAAQVNRGPEQRQDKTPLLSDLREAGDIEQDADVVILLHEETVEDQGKVFPTGDLQLVVAKNRNGPKGFRSVKKYGHYARLAAA